MLKHCVKLLDLEVSGLPRPLRRTSNGNERDRIDPQRNDPGPHAEVYEAIEQFTDVAAGPWSQRQGIQPQFHRTRLQFGDRGGSLLPPSSSFREVIHPFASALPGNEPPPAALSQSRVKSASKWPNHLVIVRHAQSERNVWKEIATAKGDFIYRGEVRDMDVGLTPTGERQAIAAGKALGRQFRFHRVFASPFARTTQTALIMIQQFPYTIEVIEEDRLREIDFGVLDGMTKHGIAHFHPEERERRKRLGKYHHPPPGGENYPDVALRLHSFLGTSTRETGGESVLLVCHSVVVLVFRKLLERLSECQVLAIESDKSQEVRNCSVTHYACDPNAGRQGKLILQDFNHIFTV